MAKGIQKQDYIFASAAALGALILRWIFSSKYLYHWDSVNFALSLEKYDVRLHQPHPPGYFLYSMLGKLFSVIFEDPNTNLIVISVLSGALGTAALYFLALRIFNRKTAQAAAVITLTSPMHWFMGGIALSYELEFLLTVLIALLVYLQINGESKYWLVLAVLLGVSGGIRQNILMFLVPVWLISLWFVDWKKRIGSLLVLGFITAAWFIPMAAMSGGLQDYLKAVDGLLTDGGLSSYQAAWQTFQEGSLGGAVRIVLENFALNTFRVTMYFSYGLLLMIIPLIYYVGRSLRRLKSLLKTRKFLFMLLWGGPGLAFLIFIFTLVAGHTFSILPVVLLLAAAGWVKFGEDNPKAGSENFSRLFLLAAVVINTAFFLWAPPSLFNSDRLPLQTPSRRSIQSRDAYWENQISYITENFDPQTSVLFSGNRNFRHLDYYFRDYQLKGLSHSYLGEEIEFPENVETFIVLTESLEGLITTDEVYEIQVNENGDSIYVFEWPPGMKGYLTDSRFTIR